MKKQILIGFSLVIVLFNPLLLRAQMLEFTENDEIQMIKAIFQNHFKASESAKNQIKKPINLFVGSISSEQILSLKELKVIFITLKQLQEMEKTSGEYYYFGEFESSKVAVQIKFGSVRILGNGKGIGNYWNYECRKIANEWKVRGEFGGTFHLSY